MKKRITAGAASENGAKARVGFFLRANKKKLDGKRDRGLRRWVQATMREKILLGAPNADVMRTNVKIEQGHQGTLGGTLQQFVRVALRL